MPQKWIKDQVPLKRTKFGKIVGTGTRICYSILSISVALGLLFISVAFVIYINFIGTSSIYMHIYCKVQVLKPIGELWAFYIWLAVSWLQQCFIWWNTAMLVGGDRSILHRKWTSSGNMPGKITELVKMRKIFKNLLKI